MSLLDLFRRGEPDGSAPELVAIATEASIAGLSHLEADAGSASGRRDRVADAGSDVVAEAIGTKLLHSWLQNRHQTLMPLSLNLAVMAPRQREGLARILASMLLAGRPAAEAGEAAPALRSWLAGLGADAAALESFDRALDAPLPLNVVFEVAQADELTIHAYVATLVASDARFPVSVMLCDMVQARFDLPTAMVRSAIRRYRR